MTTPAAAKLQISVTKNDIAKGRKGSNKSCPIALAIKRKGLTKVAVLEADIYGWFHNRRTGALLPLDARAFINRFDSGQPVKPFRFTITIR